MFKTGEKVTEFVENAWVVRGPDWRWGTADEPVGIGRMVLDINGINPGWVTVQWKNGGYCDYRAGYDNKYDLLFATQKEIAQGMSEGYKKKLKI